MRALTFPAGLDDAMAIVKDGLGEPALTPQDVAALQALFDDYLAKGALTHLIPPDKALNAKHGKRLKDAYTLTVDGRRLDYVRSKLKKAAKNRCPSCGGSRHDQLDHHLAKSDYGEFALYVRNLVPICGACNRKKSTYSGLTTATAFVHPFIDTIPDAAYIKVDVTYDDNTIQARLSFDDAAVIDNPVMKARLKHQFDRIDVNARLESELIEFMTEHADTMVEDFADGDVQGVTDYLNRVAGRLAKGGNKGSWRVAVLRTLASDPAFCGGAYKRLATAA